MVVSDTKSDAEDLDWVAVRQSYEDGTRLLYDETKPDKFKKNPFVPIGCLLTAGILVAGLRSMAKKDRAGSQRMMQLRVVAQGVTIAFILGGVAWEGYKHKKEMASLDVPK